MADLENTMEKMILGNRYEILEKIAEGGMSTIYKAYCKTLNRIVAVKVLKSEFSKDEEFLIKFNNEAKAIASLNHPNIINVYDVGQDEDIAYIVMEYVDGINLKQLIQKRGVLTEKEALGIIKQISYALREAHKNNIIHRDIKPHNIMINKDNVVKVGDFGIAKATTSATINTFERVMGSVHYFSPEQARGGYIDERSDIYSLGVMLYELTIGKPPYDGDSPINVALRHIHDSIEIPEKYKQILSISTQNMILKMSHKNMDKRYSSVQDIIKDIDSVQDGNGNIDYFVDNNQEDFETKIISIPKKQIEKSDKIMNDNYEKNNKKINKWIVILGIIIVFSIPTIFLMNSQEDIFDSLMSKNTAIIPNIEGKTVIEGQRELEKNNLILRIMSEKEDEKYEPGTIIKQNPEANLKLRKGEEVSVIVAKSPDNTVIMPNVLGKEISSVEAMLTDMKLEISVEEIFDNTVAKNRVISQLPGSDVKMKPGDKVILKVSKGREIIKKKVPYFEGMSIESARKNIDEFEIGNISYREDETQSEGIVLYQNPKGGTLYEVGKNIDFVINKLPEKKEEPQPQPNVEPAPKQDIQVSPENTPDPIPSTKELELVLPEKDSMLFSVVDKSDGKVVYSDTISTTGNPNVKVNLSSYVGRTKTYDIYINGEYYSTTGTIVFD